MDFANSLSFDFGPNVKIRPWVGKEFFGCDQPILVVGESHYDGPDGGDGSAPGVVAQQRDDSGYTAKVLKEYLNENVSGRWKRFFTNIGISVCGSVPDQSEREAFWSRMAFYNYIQRVMPLRSDRPAKADWEFGRIAFPEVVSALRPQVVIVYSKAVSEELKLEVTATLTTVKRLQIADQSVQAIGLYHASCRLFNARAVHPFLLKALTEIDWTARVMS